MSPGEELYGEIYHRGEIVCRQGEKGDTMFLIQSGAIEVSRRYKDGDLVLALLEKGDFFGEMVLVDDYYRSATVKAIQKTRLLSLTRETFLSKVQQDPGVALHLIKCISYRIERTRDMLRKKIEEDEALKGKPSDDSDSGEKIKEPEPGGNNWPELPVPEAWSEAQLPESGHLTTLFTPESFIPYDLCLYYEPGQAVYKRGEPGKNMYAIIEGEVETGDLGGTSPSTRLGSGDFFGEAAMPASMPCQSDAFAVKPTYLIAINNDTFFDQVRSQPLLALNVLRMLVLRLRLFLAALTEPEETLEVARRCLPRPIKKPDRLQAVVASLSACGGCGAALLDKPEGLTRLLKRVRFVYCPLLMDQSEIPEAEVGVVDGVVRVKEDEEKLREIRSKCRYLIAWGSCAAIGGIPSMANRFEIEELIQESYSETLDSYAYYLSGSRGFSSLKAETGLLRRAFTLDQFVRVDYYIPGCPPDMELLCQLVMEITGEPRDRKTAKIVCAECGRKPGSKKLDFISLNPPDQDDPRVCFLSQGSVCTGSQTLGGCQAACPKSGSPCWGCRGPASAVLNRLHKGETIQDIFLGMVKTRSKASEEAVRPVLSLLRTRANNALSFQPNLGNERSRIR